MSSPSLHRRLYDIFFIKSQPAKPLSQSSSRTPPPPPLPPPLTPELPSPQPPPPPPPPLSSAPKLQPTEPMITRKDKLRSIFKERDLRTLGEEFKTHSLSYWFRYNRSMCFMVVDRLAAAKQFSLIEEILEEQKKFKDITEEHFAVRIMRLYGRVGMFDHAQRLFDELPQLKCERTVRSFNALLMACIDSHKYDKIAEILREVPKKLSIKFNSATYNMVITGICKMGLMDSTLAAVKQMERKGVAPNFITYNTILHGFYQNNRFSDAEAIWKVMEDKGLVHDISSYNVKIRGLVSQKRVAEAVVVYEGLGEKGLKPNRFTFSPLLEGFCNEKNLEEAKKWYEEIEKLGSFPTKDGFKHCIALACEMGDVVWGLRLCNVALKRNCHLDTALFQDLLDRFVQESNTEAAEKLRQLIEQSGYDIEAKMKLPSADNI